MTSGFGIWVYQAGLCAKLSSSGTGGSTVGTQYQKYETDTENWWPNCLVHGSALKKKTLSHSHTHSFLSIIQKPFIKGQAIESSHRYKKTDILSVPTRQQIKTTADRFSGTFQGYPSGMWNKVVLWLMTAFCWNLCRAWKPRHNPHWCCSWTDTVCFHYRHNKSPQVPSCPPGESGWENVANVWTLTSLSDEKKLAMASLMDWSLHLKNNLGSHFFKDKFTDLCTC